MTERHDTAQTVSAPGGGGTSWPDEMQRMLSDAAGSATVQIVVGVVLLLAAGWLVSGLIGRFRR